MSTNNHLPRGVIAPVSVSNLPTNPPTYNPSPSEELHLTVKKLLDDNSRLQEKVQELEGDKRHFQRKLDEYIRSDMEGRKVVDAGYSHRTGNVAVFEKELEQLIIENAKLKSLLMTNDREGRKEESGSFTCGNSHFSCQECSPTVRHQLSKLQAARSLCIEQHGQNMEMMKLENLKQREEIERLKRIQFKSSWEFNENYEAAGEGGHSSLPESLPSFSSISSGYSRKTENTSVSSPTFIPASSVSSSNISGNAAAVELKKLKKQLDKYKTVNIELDQKLKEANLELQKYIERRGDWEVAHHMDVERLHSEGSHLKSQLDNALSENSRLRSIIGRQMY